MASAWAQMGEIQRINQRKRQAQLSRSIGDRTLAKRSVRSPTRRSSGSLLRLSRASCWKNGRRPRAGGGDTLISKMTASFVPSNVMSAPLRKVLRRAVRSIANSRWRKSRPPSELIGFLQHDDAPAPVVQDRSGFTIDRISDALPATNPLRAKLRLALINKHAETTMPTTLQPFATAATAHQQYLTILFSDVHLFRVPFTDQSAAIRLLASAS